MAQVGRRLTGLITKRQWGRLRFAGFSIMGRGGRWGGAPGSCGLICWKTGFLGQKGAFVCKGRCFPERMPLFACKGWCFPKRMPLFACKGQWFPWRMLLFAAGEGGLDGRGDGIDRSHRGSLILAVPVSQGRASRKGGCGVSLQYHVAARRSNHGERRLPRRRPGRILFRTGIRRLKEGWIARRWAMMQDSWTNRLMPA